MAKPEKTFQVKEATCRVMFQEMGLLSVKNWTVERLTAKMQEKVAELADPENEAVGMVEDEAALKLLKQIQKSPKLLDTLVIVGESKTNGEAKMAKSKAKVADPEDEDEELEEDEEDTADDEEGEESDEDAEDAEDEEDADSEEESDEDEDADEETDEDESEESEDDDEEEASSKKTPKKGSKVSKSKKPEKAAKKPAKKEKAAKPKKDGVKRDAFGCKVGSQASEINACISKKSKKPADIAAECGHSAARVNGHLRKMVELGHVEKNGDKGYRKTG